ncbi:hypothetical protein K2Q08_00780, partial [Patescibacteria group bacterium]|nr:hypothetical protein [Patescibacteria group bacterium]
MQAILDFIQHIAVGLILFGHVVTIPFLPGREPVQKSPNSTWAPQESPVSASTTPSVKRKLFPVADTIKPAQAATSSATQTSRTQSASADSRGLSQEPAVQPKPATLLPQSIVNDSARASLVNIFCLTKSGGYLYPISGSGVMITKNGIILTNAHVGQYFLLRDYL